MNKIKSDKKELSPKQREELLRALKDRFEKNMNRHQGMDWTRVQATTMDCGAIFQFTFGVYDLGFIQHAKL